MRSRMGLLSVLWGLGPIGLAQTICIDPGHPSENGLGTRGRKVTEVFVVWDIAKRLEKLLEAKGYQVVLTKQSELERVTNRARAEIANKAQAKLFIRLHCDAGTGTGLATYYPAGSGRVGKVKGPSAEVQVASKKAASAFHPAVIQALSGKLSDAGLHTDKRTKIGGIQGALTGSIYSKVPVLLVELCVLQNRKDEAYIQVAANRQEVARALATGVEQAVKRTKQ